MSGGDEASSTTNHNQVPYNYDNDKDRSFNNSRPPMFTGEAEKFPWWKSKLYSHVIAIDDELWDIIEDGIDIAVDDEVKCANRAKGSIRSIIELEEYYLMLSLMKSA